MKRLMPETPRTMNIAAPDGTPPRRFDCSFYGMIL